MKKQIMLLTITLLTVLISFSAVNAADTYVNGSVATSGDGSSWAQAFKTLSEGYTGVTDGNKINIAPGIYSGSGNTPIHINKDITIQGAGQDKTIIDCENIGGAFTVATGKTVTFNDLTIKNSNSFAGSININQNGNINVNRCTFTENSGLVGSAIYNNYGYATLTDSTFTSNTAQGGGGAIHNNAGHLTVNRCIFTDNIANGCGGAIYNFGGFNDQGTLSVTESSFTGNTAGSTQSGGAIYTYHGTSTVSGSTFTGNTAGFGGAISTHLGTSTVSGSTFTGNTAGSGGAIYNELRALTVTNSNFIGNSANGDGGTIYNSYGTLIVSSSTFTGNNAGTTQGGGAVFNWGTATITHSIFTSNTAMYGGAIYNRPQSTSEGTLTVSGCNIASNTASQGGAFYNWGPLTAHYNRIIGNTATDLTDGSNAIHNAWSGVIQGEHNWWGSDKDPKTIPNLIAATDGSDVNVDVAPWLELNIYSDPSTIYTGQSSKITANVYMDSDNVDHSQDAEKFFSGPELTFTTNLGNIGSKTITVPWALGLVTTFLRGDEGPGIATLTAMDGYIVSTTVKILQAPNVSAASAISSKTIAMQKTGTPMAGIVLAILMVLGGVISTRKNQ
ncbi:MAG: hypothetical protein HVN35_00310 [Methanobacteriaceae archaeon]|nr:hypothetical protein [Methanobacteriaceae archaeon]